MTLETFPLDLAEYATDAETQTYLLEQALASGDGAYISNALGIIARAQGMTETAAKAGITREGLYKALSATGDPRLSTLLGVLRALNLKMRLEPIEGPDQP